MPSTRIDALGKRDLAAWRGMLEAHKALISTLDAELERDHGLSLSSYEVLMYLGDAEGHKLRMGELADRLLLSRSGISRLVGRLERRGLVRRSRCSDDGRGFFAQLTPEGARKLAEMRPDHLDGVRRHFLSRLDRQELESLGEIWRRLLPKGAGEPGDLADSC
jgi:DNA-binding MarR family transcriptional regulator